MAENTYKAKPKSKASSKKMKLNLSLFSDPRLHMALGLFLLVFSVCLFIAFTSYLFTGQSDQSIVESYWSVSEDGRNIENWLGLLGASLSYLFVYKWFGIGSFLFIPLLFLWGVKILYKKEMPYLKSVVKVSVFFIFWITMTLGYIALGKDGYIQFLAGGYGYYLAEYAHGLAGWGTALLLVFSLAVFGIYFFDIRSLAQVKQVFDETEEEEESSLAGEGFEDDAQPFREQIQEVVTEGPIDLESTHNEQVNVNVEEALSEEVDPLEMQVATLSNPEPEPSTPEVELQMGVETSSVIEEIVPEEPSVTLEATAPVEPTPVEEDLGLVVEAAVEEKATTDEIENYDPTLDLAHYEYPTVELLTDYSGSKVQVTREELEANKNNIVQTLANYKIGIASIKATIGPTVTLYEIVPEAGVKISKIKNLEDDIALSLAALGIRIIAPIPGKGTIGIEVPNKNKEIVSIRSVISTDKFLKSDMALPIVFGKTISNEVFTVDLAKMPHLLMAGATGQGKSVGLNVILASLLYKKHPSQLKFVLVDPKKVELSIFSKIEKHFLAMLPDGEEAIITDTKKVVHTLNSLCIEMDARYDLLKDAQCRNLKEYNKKFVERRLNPTKGHVYMPYIVVIIDELADLMMTAGKEVETPIARLAQLARAIGIHLVVATQRPSVNVITGIIKANFPARISFKVTSKIDSRTILDAGGADQLIGMGDMLYTAGSDLTRIQCAFIDTPEVDKLVDFVGDQQGYETAFFLPEYVDESENGPQVDLADRDAMFEQAARVIVAHQQGSTSLLQRKLQLGYNRAGRLIDQLEAAGVVGAFQGSKAREVYIQDEMALEQLLDGLNGIT